VEARAKRQPDLPVECPAGLSVRLLGGLRVERDGTALALPPSKRTRALLAYLATTGRAHARSHLCDLLWDGPDDPRAELRWSMTKLRPVVDAIDAPAVLEADREQVGLRSDAFAIDLAPLRLLVGGRLEAIEDHALETSVTALEGEFLAGLELPGCHRFHQWCMAERETWSRLRLGLLAELVRRLADRPERALPHARTWVGVDPYGEPAHAALLRCLLSLGRPRDAQAHARQVEASFARELGVAPTGVLREALREVERDLHRRPAAALPPTPAGPIPQASAPTNDTAFDGRSATKVPFVGREKECLAIARATQSLQSPQQRPLLLFLGEPGIGKTRLIDLFAERATQAGARVLRARCFEAEMSRPYGAWIDALRDAPGDVLPEPLRAELAPLRPLADVSAFGRSGDRTHLFEVASAWLNALAAVGPLVLLIDDLQWLDEASAALLHFVVRSASDGSAPLLFGAAARDGEIDDNAAMRSVLHSLAQDGRVHSVTVEPFGLADTHALLAQAAPDIDAEATHRASGGNPWFALAIAHAHHDTEAARASDIDASDDARYSLVVEPLQRLDAAHRDVLACAAVMGRECRAELLAEVLDVGELELAQRLARLERRHLLRATPDGRHDFAHDLVREAIYASLSPVERRTMQRRIVRSLDSAASADPGLYGELAHHAIETEQHALAVRACISAARHCLRVYANAQALSLAERAAPCLERLPAHQPERIVATIELVELRVLANATSPSFGSRMAGWISELESGVQAAQDAGLRQAAANGLHMLSWLAQQCNDIGATREATLRAELMSRGGDDAGRCLQLANTGRCLMEVESDLPRARELIHSATALAQAQSLQVIELEWARGLVARWDGDWEAAQRLVRAAVAIARARQDRWREFECLNWLATIQLERGRWDEVTTLGTEILEVAARSGGGLTAPFAEALLALATMAAEVPAPSEAARRAMDSSIAHLRSIDDKAHLAYALNQLAALELSSGRREAATAAATDALAAAQAVRRTTEIATARALLARAAQRVDELDSLAASPELSARARRVLAQADPGAAHPAS
jgi:DNA-binding SARP family transcriptional activator